MGVSAQGMKFYISSATGVSTTSNLIGEVKSFSLTTPSMSMVDDTHMGSVMETSKPGIMKRASLSIDGNYITTDAGQLCISSGAQSTILHSVMICFSDTAKTAIKYDVYVSGFDKSGGTNEMMKFTANFDIQTTGISTTYS